MIDARPMVDARMVDGRWSMVEGVRCASSSSLSKKIEILTSKYLIKDGTAAWLQHEVSGAQKEGTASGTSHELLKRRLQHTIQYTEYNKE